MFAWYQLEELPVVRNVLKCELSLVGPRPLLMQFLPLYPLGKARRHGYRPEVTRWARKICGEASCLLRKFKFDMCCVNLRSLSPDDKIPYMCINKVIVQDGISVGGVATMPT